AGQASPVRGESEARPTSRCQLDPAFEWGDDVRCGVVELVSSTTARMIRNRDPSLRSERTTLPHVETHAKPGSELWEEKEFDEADVESDSDTVRFQLRGKAGTWSCKDE